MKPLHDLKVQIFADGADPGEMVRLAGNPLIKGFTTNPTLMRKAGIRDYQSFAHQILAAIPDRPISFEVFSDDFAEMEAQAHHIAAWGENVFVKIPITNTRGESSLPLVSRLSSHGVKVNVTAVMTFLQVQEAVDSLVKGSPAFISVFAGRVADTGRDPVPLMAASVEAMRAHPNVRLIWASPRELLNIFQADQVGCHVITATSDILNKLSLVGTDLAVYSLDTVRMFHHDAQSAGFQLELESLAASR